MLIIQRCDIYKKSQVTKGLSINLNRQVKQDTIGVNLAFQVFINSDLGGRRREVN